MQLKRKSPPRTHQWRVGERATSGTVVDSTTAENLGSPSDFAAGREEGGHSRQVAAEREQIIPELESIALSM